MPKWYFDDDAEEFNGDALYFIQEGDCGPIKIGRGDPASRLRTLQIGNPRELRIVGCLENVGYTEAFWHRAFEAYSMRGEAQRISDNAKGLCDDREPYALMRIAATLSRTADAIERGDHLKGKSE